VGHLRSPGDPSCAFAPVQDPGRTADPSPMLVSADAAPAREKAKASALVDIGATAGLQHLLSTLQGRCYHRHMQDSLPAGWLAFTGRESNPLDRDERFPSCYISSPFPGFILTLPTFHTRASVLVSRRLHAARRSDSRQAPPELYPRPTTGAWFRRQLYAFDTSSAVHSHSTYQQTPDGFAPPFPQRSPPQPLCRSSLRWFEP
jgi:hypothetical protein